MIGTMASRDEIVRACDELLEIERFGDYGPNGLQVPGRTEIAKVASGVSANLELIERAVAADADLLLVHHGLFWDFHPRALSEQMAARLRLALGSGLNVAGYHLPLDAHPECGNNALLCAGLGYEAQAPFAEAKGVEIGIVAERPDPVPIDELLAATEKLLDHPPQLLGAGPERVGRIAVVTGAGASFVHEAIALGADALITGEPAEHVTADASEGGIHFIAAGHHASERLGIRRLGEIMAERFGVEHEFIDVPNPI
jgi:dinuclear metal center YbgI/SA1388 family protein